MSISRGLQTRRQTSLPRQLSPSLDSTPTQTSPRGQNTEAANTNYSDPSGRKELADSRLGSPTRPCSLLRVSRPINSPTQNCESYQGPQQQHASQRVSRTTQATESVDSKLLLLHGRECVERDDTQIHRGAKQEMKAKKVIKCKVFALTERKRRVLDAEYNGLQTYLQTGKDSGLCKTNMRQAKRFYKKILANHEYPLTIRKDLVRFQTNNCKLSKFWVSIPIGGPTRIWLPVQPHASVPEGAILCESKITRGRDGVFWVHLVVEKDVPYHTDFTNVLAVDLGERLPATTVLYANGAFKEPRFYGREVRGIRRHYAWLRKRLGEKKALNTIRKVGRTEHRKVNDACHKISHAIVEQASRERAVIVLGDLKGIRNSTKWKGRRMNRIVSNMPYYKLTQQIMYKAAWLGVPVYQISERNTSKTCHRCGSMNTTRIKQPVFECKACGLVYNADLNAAKNLAKRFHDHAVVERGILAMPVTPHEVKLNE